MDTQTFTQLVQAIQAHEWYPAAGLLLMVLIWIGKKAAPMVWDRIPVKWQWTPAVLAAGAMAFIDGWQEGLPWLQTLSLAVYALVSTGGVAIGAWHTVKRIGSGTEKPIQVSVASDELKSTPSGITIPYDPTTKHAASEPPKGAA